MATRSSRPKATSRPNATKPLPKAARARPAPEPRARRVTASTTSTTAVDKFVTAPSTAHVEHGKAPVPLPVSYMTPRDVMAMLRISRGALHDMVKDGRLPAPIRFGTRMPRWNRAHIEAHLTEMANNARGVRRSL